MDSTPTWTERQLPALSEDEVDALGRYGAPVRRSFTLAADAYTRLYRFGGRSDRRAEVVFAIEDPGGGLWLHTKQHYPRHIYRLPSGGVEWGEAVEHALLREVEEETALDVEIRRFLGIIEYNFLDGDQVARFASYVFHMRSAGGIPRPQDDEAITDFRRMAPGALAQVAADLRGLNGDRQGWGRWRALAHDLVYDALAGASLAPDL
jgi:ADP-ribose pyrophosphatase YjhB (NUDIX family)